MNILGWFLVLCLAKCTKAKQVDAPSKAPMYPSVPTFNKFPHPPSPLIWLHIWEWIVIQFTGARSGAVTWWTSIIIRPVLHLLHVHIQWNPSTPDTIGTTVSVLISGVSLFQGLICTHLYVFVAKPSVRISGVSGFQGCPE